MRLDSAFSLDGTLRAGANNGDSTKTTAPDQAAADTGSRTAATTVLDNQMRVQGGKESASGTAAVHSTL